MTKTPGTRPRTRWKLNEWGVRVLKVGGVTAYLSDHTGGHWGLTVRAGELDLSARRGDFGLYDVDGIKAKTPELACKKAETLVWRHVTRHLKMLEKARAVLLKHGPPRRMT